MKEELVTENVKLIYHMLKVMGLLDRQDEFFDVGLIGLVRAADDFDPDRGVKFSSFAAVYIRNEIGREVRKTTQMKSKANYGAISLDTVISDSEGRDITLMDTIPSDFNLEEFVEENDETQIQHKILYDSIKELDPDEQMIVLYYFWLGYTQKEIANIMGKAQGHISKKMKKILIKLRVRVYRKCIKESQKMW